VAAIRILVVEDEPQIAELIQDTLHAAGHDCVVARDSGEADDLLAAQQVDGITLDVHIPGRDGLDWLGGLRTVRPELARKTLVITGTELSPDDCGHLASCGASMLAKPFGVEDLLDTIAKHLAPIHARCFPRD
jgi:two-component system OmpR family response regulator